MISAIGAISTARTQNSSLRSKKQVGFGHSIDSEALECIRKASLNIIAKNKDISGADLYRELIKIFVPEEVFKYKNPLFDVKETEVEIMNRVAKQHNLSQQTKDSLQGLLLEDGKVVGNKTLLDRFTPMFTTHIPDIQERVISEIFDVSLYHVLGVKSQAGPDWVWCPVIGSLRDEAIKLTGAKGTYTAAEVIDLINANK